jgi:predicted enzyme related to lactoylglutathione lyase
MKTSADVTKPARREYPPGVPCWIDLAAPDLGRAAEFYGPLFGWQFDDSRPPGAAGSYLVASLDGDDVAGIGLPDAATADPARWQMHICVDDVAAVLSKARAAGGTVDAEPRDVAGAARTAWIRDPAGAGFGIWEPRGHPGVQRANVPGSWNMNELSTPDVEAARAFYGTVLGWELDALDFGGDTTWMARVPGYGDFLTRYEPGMKERQDEAGVPPGFGDAVAWVSRPTTERLSDTPTWGTIFAVADTDGIANRATGLGGSIIVPPMDASEDVRLAVIADPFGAVFTASRYAPAMDALSADR